MKLPIFTIALLALFSSLLQAEDAPAKPKEPAPVAQSAKFEGAMGVMKVEIVQVQPTILFRVLMKEDKEDKEGPDPAKKEGEMHPISSLSLKPDEVPTAIAMVETFLKSALAARQDKAKAYAKALGTLDGKKIDFTWMPWTGRGAMMCGDSLIFEEDGLTILKMLRALPLPPPDKPQ